MGRKATVWTFQVTNKENLKRETESLLISAKNNTINNNYVKTRIDKIRQSRRCRLCGDKTINHIISECS